MTTLTRTVPIEQHPTDAARERGLAVINNCMCTFATGMRCADLAELTHEAERLESLPPSRVVKTMRAIVDVELTSRRTR